MRNIEKFLSHTNRCHFMCGLKYLLLITRNVDTKVFFIKYYACVDIKLPIESLYHLKKPHINSLVGFKDLSIHRDRQWEATLFHTMLLATRPGFARV
jgi:hypothetical protein